MQNSHSSAAPLQQLADENQVLRTKIGMLQKQAALGELVGTTTHEFNNILMTIMNYAKLGLRNRDDASRDKALTRILAASERAAKITNSVLGVARNRSDQFESVNLKSIVDESLFLLERELAKYRIDLDVNLEEVKPVRAIGNQIQQILINLIINARQALDIGGRLEIRLQQQGADLVALVVRDFGRGMDQATMKQIFDPYFSTKSGPDESGRGGTGLGLACCKDIVESHGGKIRVESAPGEGTCFTVMLPVFQPNSAPISAPSAHSPLVPAARHAMESAHQPGV